MRAIVFFCFLNSFFFLHTCSWFCLSAIFQYKIQFRYHLLNISMSDLVVHSISHAMLGARVPGVLAANSWGQDVAYYPRVTGLLQELWRRHIFFIHIEINILFQEHHTKFSSIFRVKMILPLVVSASSCYIARVTCLFSLLSLSFQAY